MYIPSVPFFVARDMKLRFGQCHHPTSGAYKPSLKSKTDATKFKESNEENIAAVRNLHAFALSANPSVSEVKKIG